MKFWFLSLKTKKRFFEAGFETGFETSFEIGFETGLELVGVVWEVRVVWALWTKTSKEQQQEQRLYPLLDHGGKNTFFSTCSDSLYFRDFWPYKMFSRNVAARLRSPHETERRSVLFIPWAKLVDGQYENCLLTKFGAAVQINLERTMGAGLRFTSLIIRSL